MAQQETVDDKSSETTPLTSTSPPQKTEINQICIEKKNEMESSDSSTSEPSIESLLNTLKNADKLSQNGHITRVILECEAAEIKYYENDYDSNDFEEKLSWLYQWIAYKYQQSGFVVDGIKYLTKSLKLKPNNADALCCRAKSYLYLKMLNKATDDFQKAKDILTQQPTSRYTKNMIETIDEAMCLMKYYKQGEDPYFSICGYLKCSFLEWKKKCFG